MIIEFYGLPGAGKTTLAKALEKENFTIVKIRTKWELAWYNFLFLAKHPIRFFRLFWQVLKNASSFKIFYTNFFNSFLHNNAKYQKALKFKRAIIDQGHFQNVISVFDNKLDLEKLKKCQKSFSRPDKLIVFEIDASLARKRMDSRGFVPRSEFDNKYQARWQEAMIFNDRLFRENLDLFKVQYVRVDGHESVEDNLEKILGLL